MKDLTSNDSMTFGERDENGHCDLYVNGKKTNVRMLVFTKEQVDKLQEIGDSICRESEEAEKEKYRLLPWHKKLLVNSKVILKSILKKILKWIMY